jgi:8-oxo-dGTP diphosphatase
MVYSALMKPQVSKDIVVAGLITDEQGRVLIVKPAHKEGWIFPGGSVEIGESPSEAFARGIEAELGLALSAPVRLLSVDYRGLTDEYVMFIFDGGVFTDAMVKSIVLPPGLLEFRFVAPEEAVTLLRPNSARRLKPTLEARTRTGIAYLEHQELL